MKKVNNSLSVKKLTTQMEWEGLVLPDDVLNQVKKIETWLLHREKLMNEWGMARLLKPGYRTLFYGPPGTGKTLTASLLGKKTGRDVYRIDLSLVVSKYIGETEKNLSDLFGRAEEKDWILFFDEADALFGKRMRSKTHTTGMPIRKYHTVANDFGLQRIGYPGFWPERKCG